MVTFIYGQSEYNILSNSIHLSDLIDKSIEYGYKAVTLTDSNLYGAFKFLKDSQNKNIKPILGLEIKIKSTEKEYKILAYAKNLIGYKSLVKISSLNKIENKLFSIRELSKYKGLIFISTFYSSEFFNLINDELGILNKYKEYSILDDFGIGISFQESNNLTYAKKLYEICLRNNLKCYPLHQTLYLDKNDNNVYEALMKIGSNTGIQKGDYYIKNNYELEEEFFGYDLLDEYLNEFVDKIEIYFPKVDISLPNFKNDLNFSSKDYLTELCKKGLIKRYNKEHSKSLDVYEERLKYELSVIIKMKYENYFLIVWDYVLFAKKNKIMVGPGRGSACGSLVAYVLGITNVDPLKFDLLFERFLNPERVSMPDIDIDFPDDKRDYVINYVKEKYGVDKVCNISAFGTFQIKSSIRDLGKILNIKKDNLNALIKLASGENDYEKLIKIFASNDEIKNLLSIAKKIENLPKHISTHAAGIILSEDPLDSIVPLQKGINNLLQAQWESYDLANIGLLKMDFLGIRNLSIVDNICKEIDGLNNINIQYLPLNDKPTFELLKTGDTLGVFQLESNGIRKVIQKLKPTTFDDIVAVLALYRPGPMDQINEFIERKHGKRFEYVHKDLEPILKSTYGIIVYQEQIILIAHDFAHFTLGEADVLRRAVSKKDRESLLNERKKFVDHCINNNYSSVIANKIYDYIVQFANYGFNKSHAVGYALLSYQMAYLKTNYFAVFMAKILNNVIGNQSEIVKYINYAKLHKIKIYKPSINNSTTSFKQYKDGLLFPLNAIFSIGYIQANDIIKARSEKKFNSIDDLKLISSLNIKSLAQLIYSGSLDEFGHTRKSLLDQANSNYKAYGKHIDKDELLEIKEEEFDISDLKKYELKALGLNIEFDSFKNIELLHKNYNADFISRKYSGKNGSSIVSFTEIKEIKTKNNNLMALGSVNDGRIEINFVMFPKSYDINKAILDRESLFRIDFELTKNQKYNNDELNIFKVLKI